MHGHWIGLVRREHGLQATGLYLLVDLIGEQAHDAPERSITSS